jgi:ATP-dependent Lon protease
MPDTTPIKLKSKLFVKKHKITTKKISSTPHVGMVNGLYATQHGLGGITFIETYKIPSSNSLELELTGHQGDIMKESMKVSKTVAWNILPQNIKDKITTNMKDKGNYGLHIHCPEAATPKDGPSAGLAITTAIVSVLTGIPINNTIAMTGEINLNGESLEIGGLESKLYGAKKAGIKKVLIPQDNVKDVDVFKMDKYNIELFENFEIISVNNIWDVLTHALMPNNISFINHTN